MRAGPWVVAGLFAMLGAPCLSAQRASPGELTERQRTVLALIDTNGDRRIDCQELAAFLQRTITERLRSIGVEPRRTSDLMPCGPRRGPGARAPESDFAAYLRAQVQAALNNATATANDFVLPGEIAALETTPLLSPLAGTIHDLLPDPTGPPLRHRRADHLSDWLHIRQSFLDEQGIARPATIALTDHAASDQTVEPGGPRRLWFLQSAVVLTVPLEWDLGSRAHVRPVAAYEVNVASNAPRNDLVVHRIGVSSVIDRADSTAPFSSHIIDATFDYRTDRGYDAQVFGVTLQYTPNSRAAGIGQYLGRGATIDFRWRPYIGLVWAAVRNAGPIEAYQGTSSFRNGFARVTGELKLGDFWKLTPEGELWHAPATNSAGTVAAWRTLLTLDSRWILSRSNGAERTSLDLTGRAGRDSPDFLWQKDIALALALKF
jgi:hypothetical protein